MCVWGGVCVQKLVVLYYEMRWSKKKNVGQVLGKFYSGSSNSVNSTCRNLYTVIFHTDFSEACVSTVQAI